MQSRHLALAGLFVAAIGAFAPIAAQDANGNGIADRIELPGTQPTASLPGADFTLAHGLAPATDCLGCHSTSTNAGPFPAWSGSMMGNSARDPVFWSQLDVAEADEAAFPQLAGARDLCLRCHMPKGWLEGRSSAAPLATSLRGMSMTENDLFGVQCAVCHRLVDPASSHPIDALVHAGLNTNPDPELRVPPTYGNGMLVVDRFDVRRGPFSSAQIGWADLVAQFLSNAGDWPPNPAHTHPLMESAFHRSSNLCGSCHDVSNPAWLPAVPKGDAQLNFPIERTWSEWNHSAYPAMGQDGSCQACHMNGPLNGVISGGASGQSEDPSEPYRHMNDVHVHDLTGGNVWVPRIISAMIDKFQTTKAAPNPGANPLIGATTAERDAFLNANFAWVLKTLYPAGTFWRPVGAQTPPPGYDAAAYTATSERARATLRRAAQLQGHRPPGGDLNLRIWNMTGHKLPTGYPEGRRMWLDVKFSSIAAADGAEALIAQSGHYDPATATLSHDFNLDNTAGPKAYDVVTYTDGAGNPLADGRRTQVYEARLHHTPSGVEFHFIRNNERVSDNRIPPLGWVKSQYQTNLADQIVPGPYAGSQMVFHDAVSGPAAMPPVLEESYNFDEVAYPVPPGAQVADVTLRYQSISREYIEELVAANPRTLVYPVAGGPSTFSRGDIMEYVWRTFDFGGENRIPPVEMARLRVALVDADGDGLPDNWESAHGLDPNSPDGNNGRNGDPDADGRSNWIEFQESTPANSADFVRAPLDLALVLDYSGSMSAPVPAGTQPKIEALKDAVELFLKTWRHYAVKDDRLAIVYFSSAVSVESGGIVDFAALPAGESVESRIDDLIAAIRARPVDGMTALGGGLQTALNLVSSGAPGRRKQVIAFTNGMQNQSPMVRLSGASGYVIQAEAVNFANGVYGDSGVTDAGGPVFGTVLSSLSIPVHTIGIGISETPDDRWQSLLSGISTHTGGLNQFLSRGFELEGAFLENLVQSLRGFSPLIVRDFHARLEAAGESRVLEFPIDASATMATFILSWSGDAQPGRLRFELTGPDGKPATVLTRVTNGASYQLAHAYFPLANPLGRPVDHTGVWKMTVRRDSPGVVPGRAAEVPLDKRKHRAADFRAYAVADVPETRFDVRFSRPRYRAGEEVVLTASVVDRFNPVRTLDRVTARITRPRAALGTQLARAKFSPEKLQQAMAGPGDALPDLAAAKTRLLLSDPAVAAALRPEESVVELFDDGDPLHGDSLARDGVFSARLGIARVPGLIEAEVTASGQTARSRGLARRAPANAFVGNAPFSPDRTHLEVKRIGRDGAAALVRVRVTPRDELGHLLGPGYRDRLTFDIPSARPASAIEDLLDGGYSQTFAVPAEIDARVKVGIDGEPLFDESVDRLLTKHLLVVALLVLLLILLLAFAIWLWREQHRSGGPMPA